MGVNEQLVEDRMSQVEDTKIRISEHLIKVDKIKKQLNLNKNKAFQEWMIEQIRGPFNAIVASHIDELDTNKSFRGKGVLKTYQGVLGWTKRKEDEMKMLLEQVDSMEQNLKTDTDETQKPEA